MARYGEVFHGYFLATPVLEVHGELGGNAHHIEHPVEIPFLREIYLVHGGHRDGFPGRIVRGEVEAVHRVFKTGHTLHIGVEECGQRTIYIRYAFHCRHALLIGEEVYLFLLVGCHLEQDGSLYLCTVQRIELVVLHRPVFMQDNDAHAVHLLIVGQRCRSRPRQPDRLYVQIQDSFRNFLRQGFFPTAARHHKRQCECRQADYNAMYNARFHQLNPSI